MRYLLFGVIVWQCVWISFFCYAIFDGALKVASDKGDLTSAWGAIALIIVVVPAIAISAGKFVQWISSRPK